MTTMRRAPPRALDFSPAEWVTVFPAPSPGVAVFPSTKADAAPPDPGADLRRAEPLSRANLLREARRSGSGLLYGMTRLNFFLSPWANKVQLRVLGFHVFNFALLAFVWAVNAAGGNRYGTRQLIAALISAVLELLGLVLLPFLFFGRLRQRFKKLGSGVNNVLDQHSLAGFCRWQQLVRRDSLSEILVDVDLEKAGAAAGPKSDAGAEEASEPVRDSASTAADSESSSEPASMPRERHSSSSRTDAPSHIDDSPPLGVSPLDTAPRKAVDLPPTEPSKLIEHHKGDSLCPCAQDGCMGRIGHRYANLRLFQMFVTLPTLIMRNLFHFYAAFVTFGYIFWGRWWGVLLGIVAIFAVLNDNVPTILGLVQWTNVRLLGLSRRVHRRAMLLALDSFLARCKHELLACDGDGDGAHAMQPAELYVRLHEELLATWKRVLPPLSIMVSNWVLQLSVLLAVIIINITMGSCVPAYCFFTVANSLILITTHLVDQSVANSQISDITDLYLDARREVRGMVVRGESLPRTVARDRLLARLRAHENLLGSFLEVHLYKSRLLGFEINFTFTRNFLVTLFTLTIGLWTLLRGSNIHVVLENVCPPIA